MIENLTPHRIVLLNTKKDGGDLVLPPCMNPLKVDTRYKEIGEMEIIEDGEMNLISIFNKLKPKPNYVPPKLHEKEYVVSPEICEAFRERYDFFVPVGKVEDGAGKVIGCKGLARNPYFCMWG